MRPAALIVGITLALVAGLALIIAGVVLGGWWRWAGGAATAVGIAAIMLPGYANSKQHNGNGEEK